MAIPVFLRDTFYLIENSTSEEIFKILKEEGVNSTTLRGKATIQFPAESFELFKVVIKGALSNASLAFYQVGDSFFALPVADVDALKYYKTDDGKLYTSEQDYHMVKLNQLNTEVYNPELGDVYNPVVGVVEQPKKKKAKETPVVPTEEAPIVVEEIVTEETPVVAEEIGGEEQTVVEEVIIPQALAAAPVENIEEVIVVDVDEEEPEYVEEYTPEQRIFLENADFLDKVLSNGKYSKIFDYLGLHLDDFKRLMDVLGEEFESEIKIPTLEEANMLNYVTGTLPEGRFKNEVGESADLTDSMIMLPVFSALLGKRNKSLQTKFSIQNLVGSQFARVSVAGINENGSLYGFVHFQEITEEAVEEAKKVIEEQLTATNTKFSDLSSKDKYELYLREIGAYFCNHKDCGKMLSAAGSGKYVELNKALSEMDKEKYSVPEFYDPEAGMITWSKYETIFFDNRGEKTLLEQAKEIIKPVKVPVSKPVVVNPVVSEQELEEIIVSDTGLPSSFEVVEDVEEDEEVLGTGLSSTEIDGLLRTLVQNNKPVVSPVIDGIGANEMVIEESINFSGLPSLSNPIAFIDSHNHEWESVEAYEAAMSSIGVAGDLLGDTPLDLLEDEDVVVKGK